MKDEFGLEIQCIDGWDDKEVDAYVQEMSTRFKNRSYFVHTLAPSYFHWHFQQAYDALTNEYYLPGVSGLLNGIEASLRTTLSEIQGKSLDGDLGSVMSNGLLKQARAHGLDISPLIFPNEKDFYTRLETNNTPVELVRLRNNVCHGNFNEFTQDLPGIGKFFTPECLRPTAAVLLGISYAWAAVLSQYRQAKGLASKQSVETVIPPNPLAEWLL